MIKERQHINKKSSSSSEGRDPNAGDENQMIKTPDNNSGDLHHNLDSIIKTETDMTALIDNNGGDVADNKSGVGGGSASNNTSPGSSNTDQKQLLSNDICISQIKHEDNGNNGIKVEDNTTSTTSTTESDFDSCDRVVLSSMGSGGPSDLIDGPGGVQPLMSNVLNNSTTGNKQSNANNGNLDAQQQQYMQQQSQIFVFSTSLANKSAESVLAGQYPTIIAYHCAQPRTKKFLEKHPLKINQFNRQNPGQWMNNVVASQQQMKHQQQLNKGMSPHGAPPKYGSGTPYSRAMKNNNSPSAAPMDNAMMQQQPGARMPMWNHQGNHINDSSPQQQIQHPSNHNMMGPVCGPGNMGMSNHGGGGPMGPGMMINNNNISNPSMMGSGPGSMINQQGNLCSMGPGSGGGMPMNGIDLDLMDHHNPHHQQHHPNPLHPSNMLDSGHRPMMGGGPHHPHHPSPHHPSGALHHRGPVGLGGGPHHHGMNDIMSMGGGGPNKCQTSTIDSLMSSGRPSSVGPSGPGSSPGGHNSLSAIMPSLADFDDSIGNGNPSLGNSTAAAHHSLAGVQVPDENLTPQQRQHREEQQATLRKLHQMLFPENSNVGGPQQQALPVTSSSSSVGGGPLDNCRGGGGMDDLMPSIDDDLDVDAVVTAATTISTSDLLLPPKTPTSCSSDWQKSMFSNDDDKKKDVRCGPPPSYHQSIARSASVPIVSVPSCSPNSPIAGSGPGVTNSNLSLPSPRTCSALNSPAGGRPSSNMSPTAVRSPGGNGSRLQSSNPGTPVHNMSPGGAGHNSCSSMKQKGPMSNEFSPSNIATPGQPGVGQQSPDSLFCHNKQLSKRGDEPNLMPVPSPQHIQYLNTFDGQELTIQKQPNTGLKDTSSSTTTTTTMSPSLPTSQNNMDMIMTDSNIKSSQANTPSNHHSPSSMDITVGNSRYPGTPSDFASPSPSAMESNNSSNKPGNLQQMRNGGYACPPSPQQMMNDSRYPGSYGNGPQHKPSGLIGDPKDSPLGFLPSRLGPGDMPLNPSAAAAAAAAAGLQTSQQQPMKHFDPISSLAQMNQQLANNVAGGGASPIVNHGGGVPSLHHPGGPGHHPGAHPSGGMMSPFGGGGGPPIHMLGSNNDPMCGPMGMGNSGMHDGGIGGPPGSGGRIMYGPGPVPPPPGGSGSGMSIGPGSGLPMGMPPIGGGRNGGLIMNNCVGGGPMSPKSSSMIQQQYQQQQQRLMPRIPPGSGPGVPYNGGANIQVKPSAPNTIQYLPNNSRGPRGAPPPPQNQQQQQQPSLDFLQRFSGGPSNGGNPLSNLDGKVPTHNLQYFPNSGGGGYNNNSGMNDIMCGNGGPPGGLGGMPPGGPNNNRAMMRGGPAGMIRLGNGNNGIGMGDGMFSSGGGGPPPHHSSCHPQQQIMMMGGGSSGPPPQQHKGGGMIGGPGPPDATQPLPPSMGGGGGPSSGSGPVGFRGGPPTANSFIGPTTTDPNYAQQFHNFQQQLYATNTRGGSGPSGPGGGGPQQFFVSK